MLGVAIVTVIGICLYAKRLQSHSQHRRFSEDTMDETFSMEDQQQSTRQSSKESKLSSKQKQALF
jgi:uncharacterized protein YaiI (UPF0178 family)